MILPLYVEGVDLRALTVYAIQSDPHTNYPSLPLAYADSIIPRSRIPD